MYMCQLTPLVGDVCPIVGGHYGMSCSKPLIGFPTGRKTVNGKPEYKIVKSITLTELEPTLKHNPDAIIIPCGHCLECRLAYSRSWADRMMLELDTQKKAIFLTLTYNIHKMPVATYQEVVPPMSFLPNCRNELLEGDRYYLPEYGTLCKRDLQLFLKRLRKWLPESKIRYFAAGEYGDKTLRPHYHLILYGISVDDFADCQRGCFCRECSIDEDHFQNVCRRTLIKVPAGKNELGDQYYTSPMLERIWSKGHVLFSDVSWKTCAYVARYVTKKWKGDYALDYMVRNCEPEFSLSSRRPGIGRHYLEQHPECLDFNSIHLSSPDGGIEMNVPQSFLKIADSPTIRQNKKDVENPLYFPEKVAIMKEHKKDAASEALKWRLENTSLKALDYLEQSEQIKAESVKSLKRRL